MGGAQTLDIAMTVDETESVMLRVKFQKDGNIVVDLMQGDDGEVLATRTYRPRTEEDERAEEAERKAEEQAAESRSTRKTRRHKPRQVEAQPE